MKRYRWLAVIGAFVTASVITLIGVVFFFKPIEAADVPGNVQFPAMLAFVIYVGLCVGLFHWLAQQMRSAGKAAFAVGAAQWVLAVDLTLRGERGLMTLAASGVLLCATWICVALVYTLLSRPRQEHR